MNDLTLAELEMLVAVFARAGVTTEQGNDEAEMLQRLETQLEQRRELESMDFDDCLGGACKL